MKQNILDGCLASCFFIGCFLLGQWLTFLSPLPAAINGIILALGSFLILGKVPRAIDRFAQTFLPHLIFFFIPVSVSVALFWQQIKPDLLTLGLSLFISTLLTMALLAWWLDNREKSDE